MKHYNTLTISCVLLCLCACSSIGSSSNGATLQAEQTAFESESTLIAQSLRAQSTQVMGTAVAAQTYLANIEAINRQLAATRRALIPPTEQVIERSGPVTPGLIVNPGDLLPATAPANGDSADSADTGAANQFTEVTTAAGIDEADGCANGVQSQFSSSAPRIYLTTRVLNAVGGSSVGAQWLFEGQVVFESSSFTISEDDPDFCIWFYIEPADVEFSPGSWSAQFLLNGAPTSSPATFTIS
jgi:hypothetical protein